MIFFSFKLKRYKRNNNNNKQTKNIPVWYQSVIDYNMDYTNIVHDYKKLVEN